MRSIAQISDLHFGRHNAAVVEALVASLNGRPTDLVVVSGDFTQRARRSEFAAACAFLNRLSAPKLIVPGNHDVPLFGLHRRIFTPFAKYNRYLLPVGVPGAFFQTDELAVLGINTARRFTGKNGRVSFAQTLEIRWAFYGLSADVLKVVVSHHPIALSKRRAPLELARRSARALQAVRAAGVHLLLSGHHHQASSGALAVEMLEDDSMLVVHAGTATSNRLRGSEGNTFNMIEFDRRVLTVTVMRYGSPSGFATSACASYRLDDGHWRVEACEDAPVQEIGARRP